MSNEIEVTKEHLTVNYNWRSDYKRKLETKAWYFAGFTSQLEDIIYCDDSVDADTIPLTTVIEEIIWHWTGKLKDPHSAYHEDFTSTQKNNFKQVSNGFLKKYGDKKLAGSQLKYKSKLKFTEDGKVLLK